MQPHSGLRAPLPLPEPGGGWLTDSARDSPKLGRGSGFKGRVASLDRCLPLRPRVGSPSARRGTRSPQRSWCAPGPSRGSPTARAPEGLSDRRAQEAGTAGRWGGSRAPRCLSGFQKALKAQDPGTAAAALDSPLVWLLDGEWPREPGIGRGAGVFTARSASEVRSGHGCSQTQRSSASPPRNCQRSPGSDTSSSALPAAVPGEGRGHKSPAPQPIRCLFPGEAGPHLPLEPTAQPIGTGKRPGTLGAVVRPGRMLQTFAGGFGQIAGNTRRE